MIKLDHFKLPWSHQQNFWGPKSSTANQKSKTFSTPRFVREFVSKRLDSWNIFITRKQQIPRACSKIRKNLWFAFSGFVPFPVFSCWSHQTFKHASWRALKKIILYTQKQSLQNFNIWPRSLYSSKNPWALRFASSGPRDCQSRYRGEKVCLVNIWKVKLSRLWRKNKFVFYLLINWTK